MSTDLSGQAENAPTPPEERDDVQGPGGYRDNAAAGEDREVTAVQAGVAPAEASQQIAAQAQPEPAGSSAEQAGVGVGRSFIGDASGYARRWESIQVGFVDDPQAAVQEAESLVSDVMGEVVATFQQQRQQLEAQWSGGGQASTDDLRAAFQRYRDFFQRLLQI